MMDRTSPDVIKEVEKILERKLASLVNQDYTIVGEWIRLLRFLIQ